MRTNELMLYKHMEEGSDPSGYDILNGELSE